MARGLTKTIPSATTVTATFTAGVLNVSGTVDVGASVALTEGTWLLAYELVGFQQAGNLLNAATKIDAFVTDNSNVLLSGTTTRTGAHSTSSTGQMAWTINTRSRIITVSSATTYKLRVSRNDDGAGAVSSQIDRDNSSFYAIKLS